MTAVALVMATSLTAAAVPATLDVTFSGDGIATLPDAFPTAVTGWRGKTVALFEMTRAPLSPERVYRYNADGSADTSFGGKGFATIASSTFWTNLLTTSSGQVVVVGQGDVSGTVIRLRPGGAPDTRFSSDGSASFGDKKTYPAAVAVDGLGRLLVLAPENTGTWKHPTYDSCVYRFSPRGRLDQTFGRQGRQCVDVAKDEFAYALTVDARNRVLVAGGGYNVSPRATVFRLTPRRGRLDTSFGATGTGVVRVKYADGVQAVGTAIGTSSGAITVGLATQQGVKPLGSGVIGAAAVRLTVTGTLDVAYDSDGRAELPTAGPNGQLYAVFVAPDGQVVGTGSTDDSGSTGAALVGALTPDGAPDTNIGPDGTATLDMLPAGSSAVDAVTVGSRLMVASMTFAPTTSNSAGSLVAVANGP
ncbi:MAG: hypothetical protein WAN48_12090 [Actinomycetes bacterium]